MALSDEEVAKIREEEGLRAQIRSEQAYAAGPAHFEVTSKKKISNTRESISNAVWMTKMIIFGVIGLAILLMVMGA